MIHASAAGRGIARAMCEHSLEHARSRGYRAMQFNFVVSTNERAVRLWQSLGVCHWRSATQPAAMSTHLFCTGFCERTAGFGTFETLTHVRDTAACRGKPDVERT
jgi:ribosomal protein S18 acetylase RimI-like enzyme